MNNTIKTPKKASVKSASKRERAFQIVAIIILSVIAVFQVFPFYIKIIDSLQNIDLIPNSDKLYLWPVTSSKYSLLYNYKLALQAKDFFTALLNTTLHTVGFTSISLIIAIFVGYTLAKLEFRGKKVVSNMLLSTMMVPGEVLMIPNYVIVMKLGWNTSLLGLILPGIVNIFGVFLIRQYILGNIPDSVLESAEIDGCSEFKKIIHIIIPMCKPVIVTYVILTFIGTWNEYLWPMVMQASGSNVKTLQLIMYQFYPNIGNYADSFVRSAGMILITIPVIVIYIIFQRYFIDQNNISGNK